LVPNAAALTRNLPYPPVYHTHAWDTHGLIHRLSTHS
jgi:hypothetical protein